MDDHGSGGAWGCPGGEAAARQRGPHAQPLGRRCLSVPWTPLCDAGTPLEKVPEGSEKSSVATRENRPDRGPEPTFPPGVPTWLQLSARAWARRSDQEDLCLPAQRDQNVGLPSRSVCGQGSGGWASEGAGETRKEVGDT